MSLENETRRARENGPVPEFEELAEKLLDGDEALSRTASVWDRVLADLLDDDIHERHESCYEDERREQWAGSMDPEDCI